MGDNSYQLNLFNFDKPFFKIDKPIRLIELFAGIGAQAKALERLKGFETDLEVREIEDETKVRLW